MVLLPLSGRSIWKDQTGEFVDLGRFLSESADTLNLKKKKRGRKRDLDCAVCCCTSSTNLLAGWQVAVNNVLSFILHAYLLCVSAALQGCSLMYRVYTNCWNKETHLRVLLQFTCTPRSNLWARPGFWIIKETIQCITCTLHFWELCSRWGALRV